MDDVPLCAAAAIQRSPSRAAILKIKMVRRARARPGIKRLLLLPLTLAGAQ